MSHAPRPVFRSRSLHQADLVWPVQVVSPGQRRSSRLAHSANGRGSAERIPRLQALSSAILRLLTSGPREQTWSGGGAHIKAAPAANSGAGQRNGFPAPDRRQDHRQPAREDHAGLGSARSAASASVRSLRARLRLPRQGRPNRRLASASASSRSVKGGPRGRSRRAGPGAGSGPGRSHRSESKIAGKARMASRAGLLI